MNPLYQQMSNGNGNDIISRFKQFRQMFKGNPQDQVQQLLNSGRITQAQYNDAVNKAQEIMKMLQTK